MKRTLALLLALMLLGLTGCGKSGSVDPSDLLDTPAPSTEPSARPDPATPAPSTPAPATPAPATPEPTPEPTQEPDGNVVTGYEVYVPDDFFPVEAEGFEFYYLAEDGSSVSMNIQEKTPADEGPISPQLADVLRVTLELSYWTTYGMAVEIQDRYFTTDSVCGMNAYQYAISYDLGDAHLEQLLVGIVADRVYTFTYTDAAGYWMSDFEDSASTIQLYFNGDGPVPVSPVIDIPLPAGFYAGTMAGYEQFYQNEDGTANITVSSQPCDGGELRYCTIQVLTDVTEQSLAAASGVDVDIITDYFTDDDVDGCPARQWAVHYDLQGLSLTQLAVIVEAGGRLYTVTYSDGTGSLMPDFQRSAGNIRVNLD